MSKPKQIEPMSLVELAEIISKHMAIYKQELTTASRRVRRNHYKQIKKLIQTYNKAVGFTAIYF